MSNILNSDDFGLKIYNRFPPKYREDDISQNYTLKRYLQALSDGGFKYSIEDINGITSLINPDRVDVKVLPILFKQYGLEVFNGIPEEYLRYLLPRLSEAWSKKGSLGVIEFITSSLSGVKTSTEVSYDDNDDPIIDVRLEMDYNIGEYFPDAEQFNRLLTNFVPFYCDTNLIYSYMFYEEQMLRVMETDFMNVITPIYEEVGSLSRSSYYSSTTAVLGIGILGKIILADDSSDTDVFKDHVVQKVSESGVIDNPIETLTNRDINTLNGSFYTNTLYSYDIITVGSEQYIQLN